MLAPKSRADREEHRTGPDSDMASIWEALIGPSPDHVILHSVHTQLSIMPFGFQ